MGRNFVQCFSYALFYSFVLFCKDLLRSLETIMPYSDDEILVSYETDKAPFATQAYCQMMNATILNESKRELWVSAVTYYGKAVTCAFHIDDTDTVIFTCDYFRKLYLGKNWFAVLKSLRETFKDVKVESL